MKRHNGIEIIRILSSFGIVCFHTSSVYKNISYSGIIIFTIISSYFLKKNIDSKTLIAQGKKLLIPWIFWFIFFGVINVYTNRSFIELNNGVIPGILSGTSIHLWYLPFIFIVAISFKIIKKLKLKVPIYIVILCIITLFVTSQIWRQWSTSLPSPYGQYMHSLNGILIGVYMTSFHQITKIEFITCMIIIILVDLRFSYFDQAICVPYAIGIIITSIVVLLKPNLNLNPKVEKQINQLSGCTLGIYLSHPFFSLVSYKINIFNDFSRPLFVFFISTIAVLFVKKSMPNISRYIV